MNDSSPATLGMRLVETRLGRPLNEFLHDAYVVQERPQVEIAAELGVDAATVSRWMAKFGIQTRVVGHRKRRGRAA